MRSVMTNKATPGGMSAGGGFILPKSGRGEGLLQLGQLHRDLRGHSRVVIGQLHVGGEGHAVGQIFDVAEQEGGGGLAVDALLLRHSQSLVDHAFHLVKVQLVLLGDGVSQNGAALHAGGPLGVQKSTL